MKARNDKFWIRHDSLQPNNLKASIHRFSNTNCEGLGMKFEFEWHDVKREEERYKRNGYRFSRCMDCFPEKIIILKYDEFDEKSYQEFLKQKIDFAYAYLEKKRSRDDKKWKDKERLYAFKNEVLSIVGEIERKYDFAKLTKKSRWDLLRVTRDQFKAFLRRYATMDREDYELLRREIQDILDKSSFVNTMEDEDGLNKKWLKDSFPTYNNEACSQLNSLISSVYASFGIISCNGRNHPFFCFCGFGGTRLE